MVSASSLPSKGACPLASRSMERQSRLNATKKAKYRPPETSLIVERLKRSNCADFGRKCERGSWTKAGPWIVAPAGSWYNPPDVKRMRTHYRSPLHLSLGSVPLYAPNNHLLQHATTACAYSTSNSIQGHHLQVGTRLDLCLTPERIKTPCRLRRHLYCFRIKFI